MAMRRLAAATQFEEHSWAQLRLLPTGTPWAGLDAAADDSEQGDGCSQRSSECPDEGSSSLPGWAGRCSRAHLSGAMFQ